MISMLFFIASVLTRAERRSLSCAACWRFRHPTPLVGLGTKTSLYLSPVSLRLLIVGRCEPPEWNMMCIRSLSSKLSICRSLRDLEAVALRQSAAFSLRCQRTSHPLVLKPPCARLDG